MIALGKQLTGNSHHGVDEHQFINPTIDQKKKKKSNHSSSSEQVHRPAQSIHNNS